MDACYFCGEIASRQCVDCAVWVCNRDGRFCFECASHVCIEHAVLCRGEDCHNVTCRSNCTTRSGLCSDCRAIVITEEYE